MSIRNAPTRSGRRRIRSDSPTLRMFRRFLRHRLAAAGAAILLLAVLAAVAAPVIAPYDPLKTDVKRLNHPPDRQNLLGTDQVGRDVLSRITYGARVSMSVGVVAVSITVAIGFVLGGVAGYLGGRADTVIMRFTDIMMTFPTFVLMLILAVIMEPGIYTIMLVIGLFSWPGLARLVRGQVLSLREQEYVLAARVVGSTDARILLEHVLPNVIGPVMVAATMQVAGAILSEAGLSFLGLGIQPPTPSWGAMISKATNFTVLTTMPWRWLAPGVAITLAVLCINFMGDGVRDALDVRGRPGEV